MRLTIGKASVNIAFNPATDTSAPTTTQTMHAAATTACHPSTNPTIHHTTILTAIPSSLYILSHEFQVCGLMAIPKCPERLRGDQAKNAPTIDIPSGATRPPLQPQHSFTGTTTANTTTSYTTSSAPAKITPPVATTVTNCTLPSYQDCISLPVN